MSEVLDRATLQSERSNLQGQLATAEARLPQLALAVAKGGDRQSLVDAKQEVELLKEQISGLEFGIQQAEADERERRAAEHEAQRQESGRRIMGFVAERDKATEALDVSLDAGAQALSEIDRLGSVIRAEARELFGDVDTPGSAGRTFLMSVAAYDMCDVAEWYRSDVVNSVHGNSVTLSPKRYAKEARARRATALAALAQIVPAPAA